jgi:hypothetical protein
MNHKNLQGKDVKERICVMFLSFKAWKSEGIERVDELCVCEVMVMRLKVLSLSAQNNRVD